MKYQYYAKNLSGEEMKGETEARGRLELARVLRQKGYTLVSFKEKNKKNKFSFSAPFFGGVPVGEKIMFSRNLSVMISAGVSLAKALSILGRQTQNKKFKAVLAGLENEINKGNTLSGSMEKHPMVFSPLFTAMVKVGEETGKLSGSLELITGQLERDHTLRKKIKGAMMYPSIIVIAMALIGILMLIYVVPTLVSTFKDLGIELPLSTRIIIAMSNFFVNQTAAFAAIVIAAIFSGGWFFRSEAGKKLLNIFALKFPLFSPLVKKINSARTARTLSSLIGSGVDVVEALSITKNVLQNHKYKNVLEQAKEDIQKGLPLSESFKKADKLYPILVGEMMAVGEETGKLSEMLLRIAVFYEEEVSETTKNMSTIIEPILMVFIGAAVGFFAISMIKPMYSMLNGV
ncbi:MAG: type II secretion system F family protein [bacterium]|nr:type II secretion system F family protein [bacterium]